MTELENFVSEQIRTLVPNYEEIDFRASVSTVSYAVEFFATVGGKRMQCFEMVDKGMFTEKDFDIVSETIVNRLRSLPDFNKTGINKYTMTLK